jgi:serine protease Do
MLRYTLLMVLLLAGCDPAPRTEGDLAMIQSEQAGLSLRELPPQTLKALGLPYGLAVVKSVGVAQRAGLRMGDVVYGVDQDRVESLAEFSRLLARQQAAGRFGLLVRRGPTDLYLVVDLAGGGPKGAQPPRETLLRT